MAGWFGGSSSNAAKPDSQAAAAIEQQIEMMDVVFMKYSRYTRLRSSNFIRRAVDHCGRNCVPATYKEGDLNKGESVCIKRCVDKFFATLEIVGQELQEIGAQGQVPR